MINNQVTEQKSARTSDRPKSTTQSNGVAASAIEVALLRAKAEQLEKVIATIKVNLSSVEVGALTDKELEEEFATIRKDLADKLTVFDGLRAQIE
ncbi:MAG: hypothetical protein O3C63_05895, partial [Cyanobacteria bacterium]|nr:hypothetical protein [Cyanobacteriota bacterium]